MSRTSITVSELGRFIASLLTFAGHIPLEPLFGLSLLDQTAIPALAAELLIRLQNESKVHSQPQPPLLSLPSPPCPSVSISLTPQSPEVVAAASKQLEAIRAMADQRKETATLQLARAKTLWLVGFILPALVVLKSILPAPCIQLTSAHLNLTQSTRLNVTSSRSCCHLTCQLGHPRVRQGVPDPSDPVT